MITLGEHSECSAESSAPALRETLFFNKKFQPLRFNDVFPECLRKKHKGEFRNDNKKVAANNSGGALCGMLL
jgi:hypothetical protein